MFVQRFAKAPARIVSLVRSSSRVSLILLVVLAVATTSSCAKRVLPPEATPPRHVELAGTLNTRDLGGYETTNGRRVRWGLIYRSDQVLLEDGENARAERAPE